MAAQNWYQLKFCSTLLILYWLLNLVKSQKHIQALSNIFRQTEKKNPNTDLPPGLSLPLSPPDKQCSLDSNYLLCGNVNLKKASHWYVQLNSVISCPKRVLFLVDVTTYSELCHFFQVGSSLLQRSGSIPTGEYRMGTSWCGNT